jgi:hypothetical protein
VRSSGQLESDRCRESGVAVLRLCVSGSFAQGKVPSPCRFAHPLPRFFRKGHASIIPRQSNALFHNALTDRGPVEVPVRGLDQCRIWVSTVRVVVELVYGSPRACRVDPEKRAPHKSLANAMCRVSNAASKEAPTKKPN